MIQFKLQISVVFIAAASIAPIVALPFPTDDHSAAYFAKNYDTHDKQPEGATAPAAPVGINPQQ